MWMVPCLLFILDFFYFFFIIFIDFCWPFYGRREIYTREEMEISNCFFDCLPRRMRRRKAPFRSNVTTTYRTSGRNKEQRRGCPRWWPNPRKQHTAARTSCCKDCSHSNLLPTYIQHFFLFFSFFFFFLVHIFFKLYYKYWDWNKRNSDIDNGVITRNQQSRVIVFFSDNNYLKSI